jgi:phospholipid/cholesterol/gamma-HCH transport system substrate-binding protein
MKKQHNETLVGLFVIFGLVILTVIIFFVSGVYLFRQGYALTITYDYVSILDKGAPVRMAGVRIGEVSKVDLYFDDEAEAARVKVKLFIEKGVTIRENYLFRIQGAHILSEPHIEITPLAGESKILEEGASVEGLDPVAVEALVENANQISEELKTILGIVRGTLEDENNAKSLRMILQHMTELTGSLNKIVSGSETDLQGVIKGLSTSTQAMSQILDRLEKGQGTAGKLLSDEELYDDLKAFVEDIKTHPWKLFRKGE